MQHCATMRLPWVMTMLCEIRLAECQAYMQACQSCCAPIGHLDKSTETSPICRALAELLTTQMQEIHPGACLHTISWFPGHHKGAHHMVLNFSVKNSTSKSIYPLTVSKWMVPSAEHITVSASGIAASSSGDSNGAVT